MALRITRDAMTLETGNRVVATARFSEHVAADGNGAWVVSTCAARLFDRGFPVEFPGERLNDRSYPLRT